MDKEMGMNKTEIQRIHQRLKKLGIDFTCPTCGGLQVISKQLLSMDIFDFKEKLIDNETGRVMIRLICYDCSRCIFFDYKLLFKDNRSDFKTSE